MTLLLASNAIMSNPPFASRYAPGRAVYRAEFGLGDTGNLVGNPTAAGEGLTVGQFEGTANGLAVASGKVVRGSNTSAGFVGLAAPGNGGTMVWRVDALPTAGGIYFDLFRDSGGNAYRIELVGSTARLCVRVGGALTYLGAAFTVAAGDIVGIRWVGGKLFAYLNRSIATQGLTNALPPGGQHGVAWTAPATGFQLDSLEVDEY